MTDHCVGNTYTKICSLHRRPRKIPFRRNKINQKLGVVQYTDFEKNVLQYQFKFILIHFVSVFNKKIISIHLLILYPTDACVNMTYRIIHIIGKNRNIKIKFFKISVQSPVKNINNIDRSGLKEKCWLTKFGHYYELYPFGFV